MQKLDIKENQTDYNIKQVGRDSLIEANPFTLVKILDRERERVPERAN